MAQISINDEYIINGKLTVRRVLTDDNEVVVVGTLATHFYFEEIKKIETYRYAVTGVEVREEVFGSDDHNILYNFKAKAIDNKYGMSNLSSDLIKAIEDKMYNPDGFALDSNLNLEVKENE